MCPITLNVMADPVMAMDGHSYDRKAIEEWFNKGNTTSPNTGVELKSKELIPNLVCRQAVQRFLDECDQVGAART